MRSKNEQHTYHLILAIKIHFYGINGGLLFSLINIEIDEDFRNLIMIFFGNHN